MKNTFYSGNVVKTYNGSLWIITGESRSGKGWDAISFNGSNCETFISKEKIMDKITCGCYDDRFIDPSSCGNCLGKGYTEQENFNSENTEIVADSCAAYIKSGLKKIFEGVDFF